LLTGYRRKTCAVWITLPTYPLTRRFSQPNKLETPHPRALMSQRQLKSGYFILEGLNSFATVYYFYYLYFFTQTVFGFSNEANLALAAFNGLIYMVFSFLGGRFAQRFGYFTALKLGFGLMLVALATGTRVPTPAAQILVMAVA